MESFSLVEQNAQKSIIDLPTSKIFRNVLLLLFVVIKSCHFFAIAIDCEKPRNLTISSFLLVETFAIESFLSFVLRRATDTPNVPNFSSVLMSSNNKS